MLSSLGKMPTTSARRFTSLFRRSSGLVEWILVRCWAGKVHVRQHVGLALVDERAELGPFGAQLVGHVPERLAGSGAIGLDERLPQRAHQPAAPWSARSPSPARQSPRTPGAPPPPRRR